MEIDAHEFFDYEEAVRSEPVLAEITRAEIESSAQGILSDLKNAGIRPHEVTVNTFVTTRTITRGPLTLLPNTFAVGITVASGWILYEVEKQGFGHEALVLTYDGKLVKFTGRDENFSASTPEVHESDDIGDILGIFPKSAGYPHVSSVEDVYDVNDSFMLAIAPNLHEYFDQLTQ